MQLFNLWTQSHEAQLDKAFMDFNAWKKLYAEWKESPEVREYFKTLASNAAPMAACSSETVQ
jgi:FMN phosphatase YigB (HAD superfamily)